MRALAMEIIGARLAYNPTGNILFRWALLDHWTK
jgi:hypothetical protein